MRRKKKLRRAELQAGRQRIKKGGGALSLRTREEDSWNLTSKRAAGTSSTISTKRVRGDCAARTHKRQATCQAGASAWGFSNNSRHLSSPFLLPPLGVYEPWARSLFPFCSFLYPMCIRLFSGKKKETPTNSAESNRLENLRNGT